MPVFAAGVEGRGDRQEELFFDLHDRLPKEMVYERELPICRMERPARALAARAGGLAHRAPSRLLLTTDSMKIIPATP